jgi:biotin operon repressor
VAAKADPELLLNITISGKRIANDTRGHADFGRLSTVYAEDGSVMSHVAIAARFGVFLKTVAKKLADLRAKGVYQLNIDEYYAQPHASRLKKQSAA